MLLLLIMYEIEVYSSRKHMIIKFLQHSVAEYVLILGLLKFEIFLTYSKFIYLKRIQFPKVLDLVLYCIFSPDI